jgi:uncharacterized protein (TIGR03435 family)
MKVEVRVAMKAAPALLALLCVADARAQSQPATGPEFEVASIKLHQGMLTRSGLDISGASVSAYASTVAELIAIAYAIREYQLTGVSGWVQSDRYDVIAKAPGGSAPSMGQARQMLQTLLADRFQLKFHRDTKEMTVFALVVGRNGPKLKENAAGNGVMRFNPKGRDVELVATGAPIGSLISQLPRMPGVDHPVLDKTGLTGKYDFRLTLTDFQLSMNPQQQSIPAADSEGASIFAALQEQLGLKLESQKALVEILAVDHLDRPSEN